MDSDKPSLTNRTNLLNRLWVVSGAVLGVVFSLTNMWERAPFPEQWGVFGKIINVVAVGCFGFAITRRCKPTKGALVGAMIFPIVLIAEPFLTNSPNAASPALIIGWISIGILAGILAGTAWLGALTGTLVMGFVILVVAPIVRGSIGWGWIFTPMGAIAGALVQLAIGEIRGKRPAN